VARFGGPPWDALRALGLRVGDYAIFGSAPLVAAGLLDAVRDVDVLARGAAWARVATLAAPQRAARGDLVVALEGGLIEVFDGFAGLDAHSMIDRAVVNEGLPFLTLADTVRWKRFLGRPKDEGHVRLIEAYLEREARR
jgi:hypothetical protein